MENTRFLECLAADKKRLREVAAGRLDAAVPSCPDWTVRDLVNHVAEVYLHKVECMRLGHAPEDWPPAFDGDPLERLDSSYDTLIAEFAARSPGDTAFTWYDEDQTVGFWIRRMAQETAVHRVDGELAAGDLTPVDAELALDGVDEVLRIFLGWGTTAYADMPEVQAELGDPDGRAVAVRSGDTTLIVRPTKRGVEVTDGPGEAAATVTGEPSPLLLWLWNRADDSGVRVDGDPNLVAYFRRLMAGATE